MVFSGRPSAACQPCRTSRLRCDQIIPMCTQCIRKRIVCTGYRDPSTARWRDETSRISYKVQRTGKKRQFTSSVPPITLQAQSKCLVQGAKPCATSNNEEEEGGDSPLALVVPPARHVDDVALTFFMCSFIYTSQFEPYLPELFGMKHTVEAVLPAIYAAAFATFSQRTRDESLMKRARLNYTTALLHTNEALSSPKDAILDETLISVLLLGLFEAVVFRGSQSPESWTAHTLGAVQLLRLRGADQFRSKTARLLFTQTITNIRTSCIQRRIPVPQEFLDMVNEASPYLDPDHPCIQIGPILDSAAAMRSRAATDLSPDVVSDALKVDHQAIMLSEIIRKNMEFTPKCTEVSSKWSYLSIEYDYASRRHAKFWNTIRMVRVFMNHTIWHRTGLALYNINKKTADEGTINEAALYTPEELFKLRTTALNNIVELETDILRSVACFIEPEALGSKFSTSARSLVWPLTTLSQSGVGSVWAKEYAVACLLQLGEDLNMEQAVYAARMTEAMNRSEDWYVDGPPGYIVANERWHSGYTSITSSLNHSILVLSVSDLSETRQRDFKQGEKVLRKFIW